MNHIGEITITTLLIFLLTLYTVNLVNSVVHARSTHTKRAPSTINVTKIIVRKAPDYNTLHPFFGWLDAETIKHTLEHTLNTRDYQPALP
jgi:hypothetical protein